VIIRVHAASASWPIQVRQVAASSDRAGVTVKSMDSSKEKMVVDRRRGMVSAP
jgi:hypothetical protein